MIQSPKTLEFLIPSYKRPQSFVRAIESVASQIDRLDLAYRVKITAVDDRSPNIDIAETIEAIAPFSQFVSVRQNDKNKGMSLNIRDMVAESVADFCTVLTDDDMLQQDSLKEIIETIDSLDEEQRTVGSFFVPRYSYLEDGTLHCIVCNPFSEDTRISAGTLNSLRYLENGFILTGLFFNPKLVNFKIWDKHIENSFFPVIYFADLLLNYESLFINKNWFVHVVNNECHWDSWGKTEQQRTLRLYNDYLKAVALSSEQALSRESRIGLNLALLKQEFICYKRQMNTSLPWLANGNRNVEKSMLLRVSYLLAVIYYSLSRFKLLIRYG
ncbi:glycosyltransferase [Chamaesiphon minutus]|uniref:Glycosyl transferase n=1 Tax=Chamaesiphon minutus (strain ATCC 27169 / PCC 6605) TaxID=1173020 RepID=K9UMC2_CHAP6|nr:glycosyltransferase [Chamaesiphon minutus]AFY95601.1 glycosyl transferase [Chamaesiphon minutus PCC 6605]